MTKIIRGIDKKFADMFKQTELYELCKEPKNELFIGIRNDYINVYYKSKSIAKVSGKTKLTCEIHEKYLKDNTTAQKNVRVEPPFIVDNYDNIINRINEKYSSKPEKVVQQKLILNNNSNKDAKYFCIDMEYVKARNNQNEDSFGRFDIIAISKNKPYKVALIELKYGRSAMGEKSGIRKHSEDFTNFIAANEYSKHLKVELVDIIKSYKYLDIDIPFNENINKEDFDSVPDFYFITLDNKGDNNKNDDARKTMQKYFFKDIKGSSCRNVEKELGINITKKNKMNFNPFFRFSDDCGDNISDIINDKLYNKTELI